MSQLDFLDIARLLNQSRTTYIELSPSIGKEGRWGIYEGMHKVHTSEYPFKVLYFYATATNEDIRSAAREVRELNNVHVVYPPSLLALSKKHSDLSQLFLHTKGVWSTKDYLRSFIKDELQIYLRKLKEQKPRFYIDPMVKTPSGFDRKLPNPLLSFLNESGEYSNKREGKLGILLADPGQGKTYMSRYLVATMTENENGFIPLMVNSSQWQTMPLEEQSSLSKTILNSFRHFDANISWIDGNEEMFLNYSLKANLFRIVFDGFDEYILRNPGNVQPLEVLKAITNLANETGTPIVITSRTSFWNANLPEDEIERFIEQTGAPIYSIEPFDNEHAKLYFKNRFEQKKKVEKAIQTYSYLNQDNKTFIGRGFVLSLIADLADSSNNSNLDSQVSNSLFWLIEALCEREILRQQLPFSTEEQINILQMLATQMIIGKITPTTELLREIIEYVEPNFGSEEVLNKTVDKLKSHPLIEMDLAKDQWRFKQEQIKVLLIADQLMKWSASDIISFINQVDLDAGIRQDIGTMIVDLVVGQKEENENNSERIKHLVKILSGADYSRKQDFVTSSEGRKLAAIITSIAIERFKPKGNSHIDRTAELKNILGRNSIRGLSFTSAVARFDFRGVEFENCDFDGVAWANCKFDETTVFKNCSFRGGIPPQHCEGFGKIDLKQDCKIDLQAEAIINNAQIKDGKRKYSIDDLKIDIKCVVNKFIKKDGVTLQTVNERELTSGPISTSQYKNEILKILLKSVIEDEMTSDIKRYRVSNDARESMRFFAANNVFTGSLKESFEKLVKDLSL